MRTKFKACGDLDLGRNAHNMELVPDILISGMLNDCRSTTITNLDNI